VPGLFQTQEYAMAVIAPVRSHFTQLRLRQTVDSRIARQDILFGQDAIRIRSVIDEGVLHRRVGSSEIMERQLGHLLELAGLPNITIQVLPFERGASPGLDGPFTLLYFAEEWMSTMIYVEGQLGQMLQDREEDVARCREEFAVLAATAASEQESLQIIHIVRRTLSGE
jgi:hypothetical protein